MAITAGNYIIRSALDEDIILLTSDGSKAKNAAIVSGSLTEADNRCYWKTAIVNTTYNQIYNLNSGTKTGYIMVASATADKPVIQGAYAAGTGRWTATASGNTMTVRGQSVSTYFLTPYGNANLYLTVPENGGQLFLSALLAETAAQEFYFDATTYVNTKLATPTSLTTEDGTDYIISASSSSSTIYPQWNSSSTSIVYEMRSRTRRYDMSGVAEDWGSWTAWNMITATKQTAGIMRSNSSVVAPAVDNSTYSQADIQIEARLTSAKDAAAYNKTGSVAHGPAVSGLISKWKIPTISISAPTCTKNGLRISYTSDYTIAGNTIRVARIMDGVEELVSNYYLTNRDYQGTVIVDWDYMTMIPAENDTLDIIFDLVESNGIVGNSVRSSLTVSYDSEEGYSFTPAYEATDRMSIKATLPAYDSIECWMKSTDLKGKEVWKACEEIATSSGRAFEICPAFGSAPVVMWVVSHTTGGNTQWGYKIETLSGYVFNTLFYVWNWVDDEKIPHAYIMKYRANAIVQPADAITLPATKFTTTGREYPIFRYTKSVDRMLDIEGAILNSETGANSTRTDAEQLATANHTIYRQPNGKWYQTAIKSLAFTREIVYDVIQISQEAESR